MATDREQEKKRREVQFGLGNNLFGAGAGAVATAQAAGAARKIKREGIAPGTRLGRYVAKRPKLAARITRSRWALPAIGLANVGAQLVNGGMDAQSAAYFARELKSMEKPKKKALKPKKKDSGASTSVERPVTSGAVGKSIMYGDPDSVAGRKSVERKRNMAVIGGLTAGGVGSGVYGARQLQRLNRQIGGDAFSNASVPNPNYDPGLGAGDDGRRWKRAGNRFERTADAERAAKRVPLKERPVSPYRDARRSVERLLRDPGKTDMAGIYNSPRYAVGGGPGAPPVKVDVGPGLIRQHKKLLRRAKLGAVGAAGLLGAGAAGLYADKKLRQND